MFSKPRLFFFMGTNALAERVAPPRPSVRTVVSNVNTAAPPTPKVQTTIPGCLLLHYSLRTTPDATENYDFLH